jgi:hypothetical protein
MVPGGPLHLQGNNRPSPCFADERGRVVPTSRPQVAQVGSDAIGRPERSPAARFTPRNEQTHPCFADERGRVVPISRPQVARVGSDAIGRPERSPTARFTSKETTDPPRASRTRGARRPYLATAGRPGRVGRHRPTGTVPDCPFPLQGNNRPTRASRTSEGASSLPRATRRVPPRRNLRRLRPMTAAQPPSDCCDVSQLSSPGWGPPLPWIEAILNDRCIPPEPPAAPVDRGGLAGSPHPAPTDRPTLHSQSCESSQQSKSRRQ